VPDRPVDLAGAYERDGVVAPVSVLTSAEADRIRSEWDRCVRLHGHPRPGDRQMYNLHREVGVIDEIARHPRLLDVVERIIGEDILLLGSRVICKEPGTGDFIPWHQDVSDRNRLTPPVQVTAWYAVDDSTVANGAVEVIPGSHRSGMRARVPTSSDGNLLRADEANDVGDEEAARAVPIELRAGQASLHHGFVLHRSGPNRSADRRCAFVLRFVPPRVMQGPGVFDLRSSAVVVRGVDRTR